MTQAARRRVSEARNAVICPHSLDFVCAFLFTAAHSMTSFKTRAADRDPQRYKEIPEVHTRQRDAPSGAFWLCVLFSSRKSTTFPGIPIPPETYQGRAYV
ncbi:hypothetical protein CWR43_25950 [Rhizobium sullae]|uniref:Uncharacterized protein n=1 Tax=Rhizobium sullae TaxID=50338 RepID=A0A2N0D3Z2_RHISU|nr:hypothetical protein CWR43_25950 [Rhizobium sullae]